MKTHPAPYETFPPALPPPCPRLRASLLLFLLCLVVYNANWRCIGASDTRGVRYLPLTLLRQGTLYFDRNIEASSQGRTHGYGLIPGRNGHTVSLYPVVTPVLVTPLYLPAYFWLNAHGWALDNVVWVARLTEKLAASIVAALSVALIYPLLLRRAEPRVALLLTLAFAFGTNTWAVSSQALWQHGMAGLLLITVMLLVTGPPGAWRALAAGAACALVPFNRPPDAILAAMLGLYALWWAGRRIPLVIAGVALTAAPMLWYNLTSTGHIVGGYSALEGKGFFDYPMLPGIAGLLFSLGRGLFVFTPFLLAAPFSLRRAFRDPAGRLLAAALYIAVVIQVLMYAKTDWRAGDSWGPRFLTDMLPFLVWLCVPFVAALGRVGRATFLATVGFSMAVQAVGAFWYTGTSDVAIMNHPASEPRGTYAAWSLRNTPFILELRHPAAMRDLTMHAGGAINSVTVDGREIADAPEGIDLTVSGWALTGGRTPFRVLVQVTHLDNVPKAQQGANEPEGLALTFQPRPDVDSTQPSGWSVTVPTAQLPPGDYFIEALVQAGDGGEFLPLGRRSFKIVGK